MDAHTRMGAPLGEDEEKTLDMAIMVLEGIHQEAALLFLAVVRYPREACRMSKTLTPDGVLLREGGLGTDALVYTDGIDTCAKAANTDVDMCINGPDQIAWRGEPADPSKKKSGYPRTNDCWESGRAAVEPLLLSSLPVTHETRRPAHSRAKVRANSRGRAVAARFFPQRSYEAASDAEPTLVLPFIWDGTRFFSVGGPVSEQVL